MSDSEIDSAIAQAAERRQRFLDSLLRFRDMGKVHLLWTRSEITEHEREAQFDDLDSDDDEEHS